MSKSSLPHTSPSPLSLSSAKATLEALSPFSKTPNATLAHFNRLTASSSGMDRVFMLYAYGSQVVGYALRHEKLTTKGRQGIADRVTKLGGIIGEARMLYRLFGLFPIITWAQSLNNPAGTGDKWIKILSKIQCWSMLIYYPLEHTYYLGAKGIFDIKPKKLSQIGMWSTRFWAAYVVLQLLSIKRQFQLLALSQSQSKQSVEKVQSTEEREVARQTLEAKSWTLVNDTLIQLSYLPLTVHWSLPNGLLPNPLAVGTFGTLAAIFQLRSGWKATA